MNKPIALLRTFHFRPLPVRPSSSSSTGFFVVVRTAASSNTPAAHRRLRELGPSEDTQRASSRARHASSFEHDRRRRRPRFRPPRSLSLGLAFVSLNAFAVYAHHDDDVFRVFYPFPFALDVGRGPSMLPTIGCGLGDDDEDDGGNLYLRDCWSHRFVWFDLNHLKDYCAMCMFRMRGGGGGEGGEDEDNHVRSSAPSSSLSRPWRRGDVVTLYNGMTNSTVTKRIVGVGGDAVRACGEYSSEYAAIAEDGGTGDDADDRRIRRGADDDDCEAETRRAGVPHDPRFPIPFCRSILSSAKGGRNDDARSGGDRGGGGASPSAVFFVVPPDHVWLEGDNPPRSTDSRHYGPVPASSLRGRVVLRLWPVERAGYRSGAAVDPERPAPPLS